MKCTKRFGFLLFTLLVFSSTGFTQQRWMRTYGTAGREQGYSGQQTLDGGYIVAGTTDAGAGAYDFCLFKTNASGDTLWTRTYGGTNYDWANSVQQTSDSGYIITGVTQSFGAGQGDVYLVKTNASGDTLWTRTYGGTRPDIGTSVRKTTDGGYIITGWTANFGAGLSDFWLIKTNASGDTLWTRTYGGANNDQANTVQQTSDSGYIIVGGTTSFGAGQGDVYLVKTNASGDTLWTRTYGGANGDVGYSVRQTTDGGYIISGTTCSFGDTLGDVWLIKTNASGDTLWTRTYSGVLGDAGLSVQQTADNGYIIAGTAGYGPPSGNRDVWLIKTNATGDTLWTRTWGGSLDEAARSVQQTTDGGYFITGCTDSYGAGGYDVWLIKTGVDGNVGVEIPLPHPSRLTPRAFSPVPNPFVSSASVPGHERERFVLYDISGRKVGTYPGARIGEGVPAGVYLLRPEGENAKPVKIVKVR